MSAERTPSSTPTPRRTSTSNTYLEAVAAATATVAARQNSGSPPLPPESASVDAAPPTPPTPLTRAESSPPDRRHSKKKHSKRKKTASERRAFSVPNSASPSPAAVFDTALTTGVIPDLPPLPGLRPSSSHRATSARRASAPSEAAVTDAASTTSAATRSSSRQTSPLPVFVSTTIIGSDSSESLEETQKQKESRLFNTALNEILEKSGLTGEELTTAEYTFKALFNNAQTQNLTQKNSNLTNRQKFIAHSGNPNAIKSFTDALQRLSTLEAPATDDAAATKEYTSSKTSIIQDAVHRLRNEIDGLERKAANKLKKSTESESASFSDDAAQEKPAAGAKKHSGRRKSGRRTGGAAEATTDKGRS